MEKGPAHCTPFETLVRRDLRSTTEETKKQGRELAGVSERRAANSQDRINLRRTRIPELTRLDCSQPRSRGSGNRFPRRLGKEDDTVKMVVDIVEKLLL
jgi:hypothetical protein